MPKMTVKIGVYCFVILIVAIFTIKSQGGEPIVPTPQLPPTPTPAKPSNLNIAPMHAPVPVGTPLPRTQADPNQSLPPTKSVSLHSRELSSGSMTGSSILSDQQFDFGIRLVGDVITHDFILKNESAAMEKITAVTSSCSCTTVIKYSKMISPGGSGTISIRTNLDQPGSKRVTLMMTRSDGSAESFLITGRIAPLVAAQVKPFNPLFFAEPKDVLHDSSVTFLDVRPGTVFDLAHLPHSMSIPMLGLSRRTYLAKKVLVLVGTGANDESLLTIVKECTQAGFASVRILRGGICLWQQMKGPLEGVLWKNPPVNHVPVADVIATASHSPWVLMVPENDPHLLEEIPPLCRVQTFKTVDDLKQKLSQKSISPDAKFGIFGLSALDLPPLSNPVFFIPDSYDSYLTAANSMAFVSLLPQLKQIHPSDWSKRIKACPTCP